MAKYRIVYGPRFGKMRYVVQVKYFLFWEDAGGDDWVSSNDTFEQAEAELSELEQSDTANRRKDVVLALGK